VRGQARVDQNGGLVEAYFDGAGCVISLAAASILMEAVEGKTLVEIKAIEYQDILDLLGIPLTTMRVKCAMLALRTLEKSIHLYKSAAKPPLISVSDWYCFEPVRVSERNTAHEFKESAWLNRCLIPLTSC
jgi:hypothetical protein